VKRVLTAVILIPIVVIALFKAPLWLFTLLVFGVALLAAHEYFGIVKAQGFKPFAAVTYVLFALSFGTLFALAYFASLDYVDGAGGLAVIFMLGLLGGLGLFTLIAALVLLLGGLGRDPLSSALPDAAVTFMALPYIAFTLGVLVVLRAPSNGALYVLYLMLLVWCGDIAAYYVGRAIGKHKLAPRISPGKSWEGAIASVLGAVVVGLLLLHFLPNIQHAFYYLHLSTPPGGWTTKLVAGPLQRPATAPLWLVALFAVVVNVAAQLGDLVESALKRGAGVKDSGTLLPGHGGVLDRIDALLFALPVGLIFYIAGLSRYFSVAWLALP
jgi:phosphatidate cytidylyltransferase